MSNLFIRPANENDIKTLTEIDEICFSAPWSEKSFTDEIMNNNIASYLVAEVAGKVVGYAGLWVILEEGHITNVAVHPDFRGKGLAKKLLTELLAAAEEAGANIFTLEVRASNESAIALYESFNFKSVGLRKKYYEDNGEDAVIMWKV